MDWLHLPAPDWELLAEAMLKIVVALILGGLIGWERQAHKKPAGLRTIIMICVGSTLIMIVSIYVSHAFSLSHTADPARIAAQVVTGIGFLGAGSIIQARHGVVGLTTAATIWVVAGLGLAIGAGLYGVAFMTTLAILVTLWIFRRFEEEVFHNMAPLKVVVLLDGTADRMQAFRALLDELGVRGQAWKLRRTDEGGTRVQVTGDVPKASKDRIFARLNELPGCEQIELLDPL